eukprot:2984782-Lingulodinium_polyedra.AAC.1
MRARKRGRGLPAEVISWNARWLASGRAPQALAKRRVIEDAVNSEAVIMIQETHWDPQMAAAWTAGLVPHTKVAASPARPGP